MIARLSTPNCASRVVSVAAIIAYGAPDEIPRNNAASGAGSVYWRTGAGTRARQPACAERGAELNQPTPNAAPVFL